jgi:hypothetical protein
MVYAVHLLLNNIVNLHAQAVDYRQNLATVAGFRQARSVPESRISAGIQQRPTTVAGFQRTEFRLNLPGSHQNGWLLARTASFRPFCA